MDAEIILENEDWDQSAIDIIHSAAEAVFSELKLAHEDVEICFLCTNNEEVQILNKTYRGIDKPTNVLSFPAEAYEDDDDDDLDCDCGDDCGCSYSDCKGCDCGCDSNPPCLLGSAAFAFETIRDEAIDQKKTFDDHLKHLVVHSVLHLLGYDHEDDEEAKKMEELEVRILKSIGVANPYSE